ncbi:telomere length regulation protein TEL2 homolog [Copidosoma floridanum]|uniref:telomere length regulation protein TEL2 homolog n=1 Tax=Copidosoma floridanum TaxID=29053 RepID=UPI0006C9D6A5|nr:telomere length regulation protein TEL2 homolog [Copidosoma floridanum]
MMNMWKVRELVDKATNVVMNYTETEAKVREATNDDAWGPTGAMMQELAQATFTYEQFPEVMSMLWKRMLQENKRNWRRTYKSLLLLNYLVRNGSERVVTSSREHIYDLRSLENYTYVDEFGKDQGINIRHKVRELIDFIQDDEKLREERKKAKKNKDKYVGLSCDAMGMALGSRGGGERWMDNPKWSTGSASNKSEGYNDWERDNGSNNSDDGEKEDSDNEGRSNPRKNPSVSDRREYCDTMETIDRVPKPISIAPVISNASPARTPKTIKKIDLGAAANYGKDQQQQSQSPVNLMRSPIKQQPVQRNKNDILNDIFDSHNDNNGAANANNDDDFNPRADSYTPVPSAQGSGDFGDFTSAFGSPTIGSKSKNTDEFADFSTAFDSGLNISQPAAAAATVPQQQHQPQISLLGATIPNIGNPMADNLITPKSAQINTGFGTGNDLFNSSLNNQSQNIDSSNINNNNTMLSNTDLLSDLSSFSAPMVPSMNQTNNLNNANLFSTDPFNNSALPAGSKKTHQTLMTDCLLDTIRFVLANKSQSSIKKLQAQILEYIKILPGLVTPQKFVGQDCNAQIDLVTYSRILEDLADAFDSSWPLNDGKLDTAVRDLFVVDGANCQILNESLLILTQAMKRTEDAKIIKCFGTLLEELMKSDALFSALVQSSRAGEIGDFEKSAEEELWQSVVQIIVSLPNHVANKMQMHLLELFKSKSFAKVLIYHVCRAIYFLNEALHLHEIDIDTKITSMMISKMFLVSNTDDLTPFVDITLEWCVSNINAIQTCLLRILSNVQSHSVENLAITFLKHQKFAPEVFGDLTKNEVWRHTLTTRIPMMSWYNDERLVKNLVSYLHHSQTDDDRILVDLVANLLDVWGDKSALNHTTFEQHLYITKIILLAVRCAKDSLTHLERDKLHKLTLGAVAAHLGSPQVEVRAVGMITTEVLVGLLKSPGSPDLSFGYEGMGESALVLVESLKNLTIQGTKSTECETRGEDLVIGDIEFSSLGSKKVYELGVETKILKTAVALKTDESNLQTVKIELPKKINSFPKRVQVEEELDSDDDLEPYDMSNDVAQVERLRPLYLRDLRDNLVNVENNGRDDPDVFSETLKFSEQLILAQLSNDDASFALELLMIFLNLEARSPADNFELLTFRACVAIVTVHPKPCAEYLAREFHTEISKYSVERRCFLLNVLAEAATRLAALDVPKEEGESTVVSEKKKKKPAGPVNLYIETDRTKQYQILYEDCDPDDVEPGGSIDWREVVQSRIFSKTRHFAHASKRSRTHVNRFAGVASSFFFPLINGTCSRNRSFMYEFPKSYQDHGNYLLTHYLDTLATVVISAQNCPQATKMSAELLELLWILRYQEEARVRLAVMKCVAAVLIAAPEFDVKGQLLNGLLEFRMWLLDAAQDTIKGDPDRSCREFAGLVLGLMNSVLKDLADGV